VLQAPLFRAQVFARLHPLAELGGESDAPVIAGMIAKYVAKGDETKAAECTALEIDARAPQTDE